MERGVRHYANGTTVKVRGGGGASAGGWLAPAFFDPQINGAMGIGFNAPTITAEGVRTVDAVCRSHGIGGFLPTVITDGREAIESAFRSLANALDHDANLAAHIPGFHLEGPYISGDDGFRGAHPRQHARNPDWDEFTRWQDAAGGRIRMVTLAPERPGSMAFIERAAAAGVVVALGHTAADARTIRDAVTAGARTSTHVGNGCAAALPRHDNPIWNQLGDDRLWASIIADGHHLPAAVVKAMVRAKTPSRMLLTCDAGSLAGLPAGRYADWGAEFEVLADGRIVVPGTPYLAGSAQFTDTCVSNVMAMAGCTLAEAIDMAAVRPRELLGLPPSGEFITFDWEPGGPLRDIRFAEVISPA